MAVPPHFGPVGGRKFLPVIPRPIEERWTCKQSGDCCTLPHEVVMTKEEATILVHEAPKEITLQFRPVDERFMAMKAGPCPLFVFHGCIVYNSRPFNCRRFACMRPDPKAEPWEFTPDGDCANLRDRLSDNRVLALAQKIQRKAWKWAFAHGWKVNG